MYTQKLLLCLLALEAFDDVGAGGEVRRHEDIRLVVSPARAAAVRFCACST